MITSGTIYLFSLSIIVAFFHLLTKRFKNFKSLPTFVMIFIFTILVSYLGAFSNTKEILSIYKLTTTNIIPAIFFLLFLKFSFKEMLEYIKSDILKIESTKIGCACEIGAKRYWFLLILSLIISFISQILAYKLDFLNHTLVVIAISSSFGWLASYTILKEINGSKEIAITMFYILVALFGSQLLWMANF